MGRKHYVNLARLIVTHETARYTAKYDRAGVVEASRMMYAASPCEKGRWENDLVTVGLILTYAKKASDLVIEKALVSDIQDKLMWGAQINVTTAPNAVSQESNYACHKAAPRINRNRQQVRLSSLVALGFFRDASE